MSLISYTVPVTLIFNRLLRILILFPFIFDQSLKFIPTLLAALPYSQQNLFPLNVEDLLQSKVKRNI